MWRILFLQISSLLETISNEMTEKRHDLEPDADPEGLFTLIKGLKRFHLKIWSFPFSSEINVNSKIHYNYSLLKRNSFSQLLSLGVNGMGTQRTCRRRGSKAPCRGWRAPTPRPRTRTRTTRGPAPSGSQRGWPSGTTPSPATISTTYRSGTVNSKSFVGKVLLRIKWKFELN